MGFGEGESEMYGESIGTYNTLRKIDSQWEFVVCLRKFKQGLWINLEQWDGEGGGRGVQDGEHVCTRGGTCVDVWQNQYNIVK